MTVQVLQKAVTPQQSQAYLSRGLDDVAGYVVDAAGAAQARTVAEVFALHGLGFAGSPHRPDAASVDLLRFEATELMRFDTPVGGTSAEAAAQIGGRFVERPPFTGTGFAAWDGPPTPMWFLDSTRLPPGSELWRIHADGQEELVAVYRDVGFGWAGVSAPVRVERASIPSLVGGPVAVWQDVTWPADVLPDGRGVALAASSEPPMAGFERTDRLWWRREVPLAEVGEFYELWLTCTWRDQPFRVIHRWQQDGATLARLFYLGRNAELAEGLRLTKLDAGVYTGVAPVAELADVQAVQNTPPALADHAPR